MVVRARHRILEGMLALSRVGERRGWHWLTYHPGLFLFWHWLAWRDAPQVADSIVATFPDAMSFADVGAGTGPYAARLQRGGKRVTACEHSPVGRLFARLQGVRSIPFDLNDAQPAALSEVDVACSFEVAEHLPPALGERLVRFLIELAPTVIFTAAQPGQGGSGHINEQPPSYWAESFSRSGASLDSEATTHLAKRFAAAGTVEWLAPNVQVFRRASQTTAP